MGFHSRAPLEAFSLQSQHGSTGGKNVLMAICPVSRGPPVWRSWQRPRWEQ